MKKQVQLTLQLRPARDAALERRTSGRSLSREDRQCYIYLLASKVRPQDVSGDHLLCLALAEYVNAMHRQPRSACGRPPSRFFSQSSPSEYSASHSLRRTGSGRSKTEAPPRRSTTTRAASSNWFIKVTDWVASRTWPPWLAAR